MLSLPGFVRCPKEPGRQDGASRAPGRGEWLWGSAEGCEQCLSSSAQNTCEPQSSVRGGTAGEQTWRREQGVRG